MDVRFELVDAASVPAQWAMAQYFEELQSRIDGGFDIGDALTNASQSFSPPAGMFVVALTDDQVAGCGAVQFLDSETAEAKRMWINPDFRGQGLGRRMLLHLEDEARTRGATRMVLDTNGDLKEARALYANSGYMEVDAYNENPYAHHWFSKLL